jgi:hypothetical protein
LRVSKAKTDEMFKVARRHHANALNDPNAIPPIPCSWVRNDDTGELIVYSPSKWSSDRIEEALRKEFGGWHKNGG